MKKWLFFIIFLVIPFNVFGYACLEATDFEVADTNGQYMYGGEYEGLPWYKLSSSRYILAEGGTTYELVDNTADPPTLNYTHYCYPGSPHSDPVGEYAVCNGAWSGLGGYVAECAGSPPPGNATSTATTTPATFQEWLFVNGIIIFILALQTWYIIFRPVKETFK
jgi:hypothetical protein